MSLPNETLMLFNILTNPLKSGVDTPADVTFTFSKTGLWYDWKQWSGTIDGELITIRKVFEPESNVWTLEVV